MKYYRLYTLLFLIFTVSCQSNKKEAVEKRMYSIEDFTDYSFVLLETDYKFDLKKRTFKIDFYKFSDSVKLSSIEEKQIGKVFFENYIDTLRGDNILAPVEPLIMPAFGDSFYIYKNGLKKSFIRILNGKYKSEKLKESEKNLLNFRNDLMKILENNPDFQKCLDTLESVKKYDNRLFL